MPKVFLLYLMVALSVAVAACTRGGGESASKQSAESSVHKSSTKESAVAGAGIADALKNKKLANYGTISIGAAFDGYKYFIKKEWHETRSPSGKIYIDFIGGLDSRSLDARAIKAGISARALDVKFIINPDGSFFVGMVTRIDIKSDGKQYGYPLDDSDGMLAKIYANKEITF